LADTKGEAAGADGAASGAALGAVALGAVALGAAGSAAGDLRATMLGSADALLGATSTAAAGVESNVAV
jgi:hypothetical protein